MAGARTQIAGVVTAMMALLTMLLLSPVIALIPQAVLASIVIILFRKSLARPKVVAIDFSGVFDLEFSALKALMQAVQRMHFDLEIAVRAHAGVEFCVTGRDRSPC